MPTGNPLKKKLRAGEACFGSWLLTTSADMAEIMAYAGLDFLLIDHEHGQGAIDDAVNQLRAMKGSDCAGVLRVPSNDRIYIKRALDAGVAGIMVPNIDNAEQAKAVVDSCRYAPKGTRGAFGGMRAMRYGLNPGYYGEVEDETLIVVQVENTKAIDNIPEIAAVPGIDIVFIGPRDLSATLGKLNDFSDPAVRQEIERAERAIVKSGKLMGSTAVTGKVAREMVERGHRFLISGSDATLLGSAAAAMMADARAK